MTEPLRLLAIMAHPDDESLGLGGVLARYHAEGIETYLVVATRGERGWQGPSEENPGLAELGKVREAELLAAGRILGLEEVIFLDYIDGDLDQAHSGKIIPKISRHIRRIRPQVVVSFPLDGAYGHPDHIAISQFAMGAVVHASQRSNSDDELRPHTVEKFYYSIWNRKQVIEYESIFGELRFEVDGQMRGSVAWEPWTVTSQVDTPEYWQTVLEAVACHKSQIGALSRIMELDSEIHRQLWGTYSFVRVFSLVNGGRGLETDLFEGLR